MKTIFYARRKKDAFPLGTKLKAVAPYLTYPRLSGVMLPAEVDEV